MSEINMMQSTGGDIGTKNVTINSGVEGLSDVQAGIQFIYDLREHIVDVGVATLYLFSCYALYLWLRKRFSSGS